MANSALPRFPDHEPDFGPGPWAQCIWERSRGPLCRSAAEAEVMAAITAPYRMMRQPIITIVASDGADLQRKAAEAHRIIQQSDRARSASAKRRKAAAKAFAEQQKAKKK